MTRLPTFADSPVRMGGDKCEIGIQHFAAEGGSASAGSAAPQVPRAAARGPPLIEQMKLELEKRPVGRDLFLCILEGSHREIKRIHRRDAKDVEKCK